MHDVLKQTLVPFLLGSTEFGVREADAHKVGTKGGELGWPGVNSEIELLAKDENSNLIEYFCADGLKDLPEAKVTRLQCAKCVRAPHAPHTRGWWGRG